MLSPAAAGTIGPCITAFTAEVAPAGDAGNQKRRDMLPFFSAFLRFPAACLAACAYFISDL